jgi:hypothetical protein
MTKVEEAANNGAQVVMLPVCDVGTEEREWKRDRWVRMKTRCFRCWFSSNHSLTGDVQLSLFEWLFWSIFGNDSRWAFKRHVAIGSQAIEVVSDWRFNSRTRWTG